MSNSGYKEPVKYFLNDSTHMLCLNCVNENKVVNLINYSKYLINNNKVELWANRNDSLIREIAYSFDKLDFCNLAFPINMNNGILTGEEDIIVQESIRVNITYNPIKNGILEFTCQNSAEIRKNMSADLLSQGGEVLMKWSSLNEINRIEITNLTKDNLCYLNVKKLSDIHPLK